MSINWKNHLMETKELFTDKCICCGNCIRRCQVGSYYEESEAQKIMKEVKTFFEQKPCDLELVKKRALLCLECFHCYSDNVCPIGIKGMDLVEVLRYELRLRGLWTPEYDLPGAISNSKQRFLHKCLNNEEYALLTQKSPIRKAKTVFFPGCNVYNQPQLIIKALRILQKVDDDVVFIPGLQYCCRGNAAYNGDLDHAESSVNAMYETFKLYEPDEVVFWCPTCLCRALTTFSQLEEAPFKIISFGEFLDTHLSEQDFKQQVQHHVTLHEPCKSAFVALNSDGSRNLMKKIPGLTLTEMERSGQNTQCCGYGFEMYSETLMSDYRKQRFKMAEATGADTMVDVCHACHEFFTQASNQTSLQLKNYVDILYEALQL